MWPRVATLQYLIATCNACTDVDSKIRFSIEPLPTGDDAFDQWREGMKAVAGLPMGIPADFRKKVNAQNENYIKLVL